MKKAILLVLVVSFLIVFCMSFLLADSKYDYQAIKKAVKENPQYEPGKEVKWFKLLVTDNRLKKDKVRITLPLVLVEALAKCTDDKHLDINTNEFSFDLKDLFDHLKKVGPVAFIEIYEDDVTIKAWFE